MKSNLPVTLFPIVTIIVLTAGMAGCANMYVANYLPAPGVQVMGGSVPSSGKPQVIVTDHIKAEAALMEKEDYAIVGTSTFETDRVTWLHRAEAVRQAEAVGADLVILKTKVVGQITGSVPIKAAGEGWTDTSVSIDEFKCSAVYLRRASPVGPATTPAVK